MNKNRYISHSILLTMFLSMVGAKISAHDFEVQNADGVKIYYLKTSNSEVAVSYQGDSYSSYSNEYTGNVVIPASVTYNETTYSVTRIGWAAFWYCSGLTSVTIPNSVTIIEDSALSGCSGLTSVTIPNSVTSIGVCAFSGCSNLTSMEIPNSVTSIGSSAFSGCSGLTSVTIPYSVTSIGNYAFSECRGLKKVIVPDIAAWCKITFGGTTSNPLSYAHHLYSDAETEITDLTIPNSVTSIGNYAFRECSGLTSITIPNSVTSIGGRAFSGCSSGLTSITVESGNKYYDSRNHCNAIIESSTNTLIVGCVNTVIPNSVTSIGVCAFSGCSNLTSMEIPNSVTSIGDEAFGYCSGLTLIDIPNSVTSIGDEAFIGTAWYNSQPDGLVYIGKVAYTYKGTMPVNTSVVIKEGTLSIGGSAFQGCSGLTLIDIPNSVTSIGNWAFSGCSGLTSVTIPNSVTSIGEGAFYSCRGLTSISIPNSVTSIGEMAFAFCSGLTSIDIPNSVTSIGGLAFYYCSGLTSVTIPNSVTSIGNIAFESCSKLKKVIVPDIAAWCRITFGGTTSNPLSYAHHLYSDAETEITELTIPNSVTSIGNYAFRECSGLTSVTIPNSVTSIGWNAFYNCSGLTSITVESGNKYYDSRNHCNAIIESSTNTLIVGCVNTVIPNSVTSIGERAFLNCSGLTSVTIPNSVTSIDECAFEYCRGLTSVTIPNSVTSIGGNAFYGCSGLTSVAIPNSVTSIGERAFRECSSLTSVKVGFSTPLPISSYTFPKCTNATLYVPFGSKAAFEAADYWKDFMEIRSYSQDIPYATNSTVYSGFLSEIPVVLESEDEYGGLQFEVTLPSGLTLESLTKSERLGDSFTLTKNHTGYNTYQILLYNIARDSFEGTEGPLFTMDVRVAKDMKAGDYELVLRNIVLSDIDANEVTADDSRAVLHVVKVLTGDANLDTRVNVSDIMAVANYILKVPMSGTFSEKSADVDRNNRINVTDILGIANIILKVSSPYYVPKAAEQRMEPQ